ncbi:hypothetical protein [Microtetraspora malaysiensis]|uniref:hypothetical protein n=1 Tax=Microtetraspora malaysiensis TaxID=161358 RepID=UPI003D9320E4
MTGGGRPDGASAWAERTLARRGGFQLVVARHIPGGRTAVTITMGVVRFPVRAFSTMTPMTGADGVPHARVWSRVTCPAARSRSSDHVPVSSYKREARPMIVLAAMGASRAGRGAGPTVGAPGVVTPTGGPLTVMQPMGPGGRSNLTTAPRRRTP